MTAGFKHYVCFEEKDGSIRLARATSVWAIIEKYKLKPVNGEYKITKEMILEAQALDLKIEAAR